jgi:hypothetical protein
VYFSNIIIIIYRYNSDSVQIPSSTITPSHGLLSLFFKSYTCSLVHPSKGLNTANDHTAVHLSCFPALTKMKEGLWVC